MYVRIGDPTEEEVVIRKKLQKALSSCKVVNTMWLLTKNVGRSSTITQKMDIVIVFQFGRDSANLTRNREAPCILRWAKKSP
jgi:hypothetical protein